jgi:hypothetical protein
MRRLQRAGRVRRRADNDGITEPRSSGFPEGFWTDEWTDDEREEWLERWFKDVWKSLKREKTGDTGGTGDVGAVDVARRRG